MKPPFRPLRRNLARQGSDSPEGFSSQLLIFCAVQRYSFDVNDYIRDVIVYFALRCLGKQLAVTIKRVAKEAGVSVASVSRALNGHDSVTEETRQHIISVATRLRYVPHSAARSLITRRTDTIGALLPDLYGEFFSELIRGIDLAARARGLHLLVSSSHGNAREAAAALRAMQGRVDGLLILSPHVDEEFLRDNLPEDLPVVLLNSAVDSDRYLSLSIDNFGGAWSMVEHLIGSGKKHVNFIRGPDQNFDAQQRESGFLRAMKSLRPDLKYEIFNGDFSEESGFAAGKKMSAAKSRPDAIFAANDMMAVGCLYALAEAGVRVPEEIALVGFDDIPIARYVAPSLSTVRVRIVDLGGSALNKLAVSMEKVHETSNSKLILPCEVIIRRSCGTISRDAQALPSSS